MVKKIALEEHFLSPGLIEYWLPTMTEVARERGEQFFRCLTDFGELRLQGMDHAGIARSVLSIAGPGVQAERDAARAVSKARESNDFLRKKLPKRPDRYSGFAHLPMQDAEAAANELERCIRELKFCGAMIDGHTNGQYLDAPELYPFWERADALGATIYLHPADPVSQPSVLSGYKVLMRPMWGWGFETGSHALRLIVSGHFDRFPRSKLMLGHLARPCRSCCGVLTAVPSFMASSSTRPPPSTFARMSSSPPRACARRSRSPAHSTPLGATG